MSDLEPSSAPQSSPGPFAKSAAVFSLIAPALALVLAIGLRHLPVMLNPVVSALLACVPPVLVMFGFLLGSGAMLVARRNGQPRIFWRALAGTLVSGLCLLIFIAAIIGSELMRQLPPDHLGA